MTLGLWLHRLEGGGGDASLLASVVVSGACSEIMRLHTVAALRMDRFMHGRIATKNAENILRWKSPD